MTQIVSRIVAVHSITRFSPTESVPYCGADFQIAGLLKDNEKIQSNPEVPPSEDDTEIKKIKKVKSCCLGEVHL